MMIPCIMVWHDHEIIPTVRKPPLLIPSRNGP
jgi:hypothetical protein